MKRQSINNNLIKIDSIKYLRIGVPKEIFPNEKRVSIVPKTVLMLMNIGFDVFLESGAGISAGYSDTDYANYGATIVNAKELYEKTDILVKIRPPQFNSINNIHESQLYSNIKFLISHIYPRTNTELIEKLVKNRQITVIANDCVPR